MNVEVLIFEVPIQREHYCFIRGLVDWLWAGNPRFQFDVLLLRGVANPMLILEPIARCIPLSTASKSVMIGLNPSFDRLFASGGRICVAVRGTERARWCACVGTGRQDFTGPDFSARIENQERRFRGQWPFRRDSELACAQFLNILLYSISYNH